MNVLGPWQELKGENERRKHHISILPFRLLLICFFRLFESVIPLKTVEQSCAQLQINWEPFQVEIKFSPAFLNMEMHVQPSIHAFSESFSEIFSMI